MGSCEVIARFEMCKRIKKEKQSLSIQIKVAIYKLPQQGSAAGDGVAV